MKTRREGQPPCHSKSHAALRALKWIAVAVFGLAALCVAGVCLLTWWLTPERLTSMVNEEASKVVNADVRVTNLRYTLWSSWPHLVVEADSLHVRSRNFDSLPAAVRKRLPAGADFLASTGKLRGGLNLLKALDKRIMLRDVEVDSLRVNLVAVTDSLNNFDIVQSEKREEMPYFHIDGMKISHGGDIDYTGVASSSAAHISLDTATLVPNGGRDRYALRIMGDATVSADDVTFLNDFPFELDGDVSMRFRPFGMSTTDYRVSLGDIRGNMSMDVEMGQSVRLDQFSYRLRSVTLDELVAALPWLDLPALKHLHADLAMDLSARLTTPYIFSSAWLPSVAVDFNVPGGKVSYTLADGDVYRLEKATLAGTLMFDGRDPGASYVDIPTINLAGMGTALDMQARVTNLTTEPEVRARLNATCDLQTLGRSVSEVKSLDASGDVRINGDFGFRLSGGTLYGTVANVETSIDRASARVGGYRVSLADFKATTSGSCSEALMQRSAAGHIPLKAGMKAGRIRLVSPRDTMALELRGASASAGADLRSDGKEVRGMRLSFANDTAWMDVSGMRLFVSGLMARFDGKRNGKNGGNVSFIPPVAWQADSPGMTGVSHSPQYITASLPAGVRTLMQRWGAKLDLRVRDASLATPGFNSRNTLSALDMTATCDSLLLRHVELASGVSRGRISGRVANLRQFLTCGQPAPLKVNLDVDIDTIQINELARAYAEANPESAIARGDKEAMAAGIDTVAFLVPRNLQADIDFHALQTRYINLRLNNLDGKLRVRDGMAQVDTLHIGSDFGEAMLKMHYDSRDIQNLNMAAKVNISEVNIVNFFRNFPKLPAMWPALNNLSGMLSAGVDARLLIFPDMYINVPSVMANAHVRGRDLLLKQNRFIRHVTRMLMIPTSDPLHIEDIDIHAGVHTNLLEVFPFTFEVCNYKLLLEGLNNFNGDMFYHIGVERWPLRLPFGVNIKGNFHDPVVRFGGKKWHDREGAKITVGVEDSNRVNMLKMARQYMGEFVHTAAVYNE